MDCSESSYHANFQEFLDRGTFLAGWVGARQKEDIIRNDFESTVLRGLLHLPENKIRFITNTVKKAPQRAMRIETVCMPPS